MARNKKTFDDDGRTVADMSILNENSRSFAGKSENNSSTPYTGRQRAIVALGATSAALLIALVFILGIGAVIGAFILVWRLFN